MTAVVDGDLLLEAHRRMLDHFGPLHWWPGETPFEVVVGAILTQNTAWSRVVPAIEDLRSAGLLDAVRLHAVPEDRLRGERPSRTSSERSSSRSWWRKRSPSRDFHPPVGPSRASSRISLKDASTAESMGGVQSRQGVIFRLRKKRSRFG